MNFNKGNRYFKEYKKIRDETLKFYLQFNKEHLFFMCKKGCADCCDEFSLFPVEFHYINTMYARKKPKTYIGNKGRCIFLKKNTCSIYDIRPINCIIQGLFLLFRDDSSKSQEIVICPKNENMLLEDFNKKFRLFQYDLFLAKMITLNELFCQEYQLKSTRRISINKLFR